MQSAIYKDGVAIALSMACIVHCAALPVLAISSPFVSAIAEAEWVHWVMAVLAVLASTSVVVSAQSARILEFLLPAALGAMLIVGALFAESVGLDETFLTITGGLLLAFAHVRRIVKKI